MRVIEERFIALLLYWSAAHLLERRTAGFPIARRREWDLIGRWRGRRQRLAKRQSHCRDLLCLCDDDFLSHAPERLIVAIAQFGLRHLDCALMMRRHHRNEVSIDIA